MTNEKAKKMLKAKLECLKRETSGTDDACNQHLCEGCSLNYEQGNMGEQKEALEMAIKALEQTGWIPVSEEPKEQGSYITTIKYGDKYAVGQRYYHGKYVGWEDSCVIAYMPLPEPYKAESEE